MPGLNLRDTQIAQRRNDFVRFGIAPLPVLGINDGVIGSDVEDAVAALAQLGCHPQRFGYGGCQTGGPGQIVSLNAIRDGDFHGLVLGCDFGCFPTVFR
jgi:hypothetical protein